MSIKMEIHYHISLILIFFFIFPFPVKPSIENTTFSFAGFNKNKAEINLEGDAYMEDHIIELTRKQEDIPLDGSGSVGRATYYKSIHLWDKSSGNVADFATHFCLVIRSNGNKTRADGIAFFLAFNGSRLLPSSGGGKLGLFNDKRPSSNQAFVAVEFDTYWNVYIDPVGIGDHIGINLNSISSAKYVNWTRNDISEGGRVNVSIFYDSSSKNLSITVRNGDNESSSNNINVYKLSYRVDLKYYLPEWVTCGFSSATKAEFFERNQIYLWNFSSTLQLPGPVKPPSEPDGKGGCNGWLWGAVPAMVLVLVGSFVWLGMWMKRKNQRPNEHTSISAKVPLPELPLEMPELREKTGCFSFGPSKIALSGDQSLGVIHSSTSATSFNNS